jgi:anti-sigma factor RsiW
MDCTEARYLMPLYESSELDARAMAQFEMHIHECGSCAREIEQLRSLDNLLRDAFVGQEDEAQETRARFWQQFSAATRFRRLLYGRSAYLKAIAAILLIAISGGIMLFVFQQTPETVYASAVDDHKEEIVERAPRQWTETLSEIDKLALEEKIDPDVINNIKLSGYRLSRATVCDLSDKDYMHLVFNNDTREISVFVRRKDSTLPGPTIETVNGCGLHADSTGKFEVAGFQSARFTVLIVSDLPRAESLRLAREAAEGFA